MLKYYKSPFHAVETSEVAEEYMLKADLLIAIRYIIEKVLEIKLKHKIND